MTVGEMLSALKESNGAHLQLAGKDANGQPKWAVFAVLGQEEATRIYHAVGVCIQQMEDESETAAAARLSVAKQWLADSAEPEPEDSES